MKKILAAVVALFVLISVNAINVNASVNKKSSEEVSVYKAAGLLYVGSGVLKNQADHLSSAYLSLIQNQGYVTYEVNANGTFDAYTLEVIAPEQDLADPHERREYTVVLKMFQGKNIVQEDHAEIVESEEFGTAKGKFYTNLAVNASYKNGKFHLAAQEPSSCGKEIDIRRGSSTVKVTESVPVHACNCEDPYHCSCQKEHTSTVSVSKTVKNFTVYTEACKLNDICVCPQYIEYAD